VFAFLVFNAGEPKYQTTIHMREYCCQQPTYFHDEIPAAYCAVFACLSDVELVNRLQEAGTLHRTAVELCQQRAGRLQKALDVAEHVHNVVADISSQLNHIHDDSVAVHSSPATDRATIQRHLSELQVTRDAELQLCDASS